MQRAKGVSGIFIAPDFELNPYATASIFIYAAPEFQSSILANSWIAPATVRIVHAAGRVS
jgi:hypothetical protein